MEIATCEAEVFPAIHIGDSYFMVYKIIPIYNWVGFFIPYIIYSKQLAFFLFSLLKCVSSDSMESHNIPNVFPCFFSRILPRIRDNFSHPARRSLKSCDQGRLDDFLNFSLLPDLVRRHQVVGILTEKNNLSGKCLMPNLQISTMKSCSEWLKQK